MEAVRFVAAVDLRRVAHAVEQMGADGTEGPHPGAVDRAALRSALGRIDRLLGGMEGRDRDRRGQLIELRDGIERLGALLAEDAAALLVYLAPRVWPLAPRLRAGAVEVDFAFGDRDGEVSETDLRRARHRYAQVRGPVGWNRLLLADELERALFPHRSLGSSSGPRLLPTEWRSDGGDPMVRLTRIAPCLDDQTLGRTFADIAARLACEELEQDRRIYRRALSLLGEHIRRRDGPRPTITDIARVGARDPTLREQLSTPIEMSRKLSPSTLLDPFLSPVDDQYPQDG